MSFLDLCDQDKMIAKRFRRAGESLGDCEDREERINTVLAGINERNQKPKLSQGEQAELNEQRRLQRLYDTFPRQRPITGQPISTFVIGNAQDAVEFRQHFESMNTLPRP